MTILEIIKELNIRKGYSPVYGECKISIKIDGTAIIVSKGENHLHYLNKDGKILPEGECLIFPSKDNRDWESLRNKVIPYNTPILVSDNGENWYLEYYRTNYDYLKLNWSYAVLISEFDFKNPESNLKKSLLK